MPWTLPLFLLLAQSFPAPTWIGDPEALAQVEGPLETAWASTEGFAVQPSAGGSRPLGAWRVQVHPDGASFENATGSPPQRAACWVGLTLHLRPWEQLRRRDLGALLRHELVHHRLRGAGLRRWEEEARCLWAETHTRPPVAWPAPPEAALQERLDRALARGTTATQAWAYRWLRAWLEGRSLPVAPEATKAPDPGWVAAPAGTAPRHSLKAGVRIHWPEERLPARMEVDGRELRGRGPFVFQGRVSFGPECPVRELEGHVEIRGSRRGWRLLWETDADTWVAAAVAGELGQGPPEAKRALAAVLRRWLEGHRDQHPDGSLCPLTHCAVVRGLPSEEELQAARSAPKLDLEPRFVFFTGSAGGVSFSPREAWGRGPVWKGCAATVAGDPWGSWERTFDSAQVQRLKRDVKPGLRPGQKGLRFGASGPYAVEALRLAAGRAFGWKAWPSNACEAELLGDGRWRVRGWGWGHNVGLCLASAMHWAKEGMKAEEILDRAFGLNNDGLFL